MIKYIKTFASRSYTCPFFQHFFNQIFHLIETITIWNYADGNAIYFLNKNADIVIIRYKHDFCDTIKMVLLELDDS